MDIPDSIKNNSIRHIQWGGVFLLLLALGLLAMALFPFKPDWNEQEQNALAFVRSDIQANYGVDLDKMPVPEISLDLIQEALQDHSASSAPLVINGVLQIPILQLGSAIRTKTPTLTATTLPSTTETPVPTITGTLPTATKTATRTRTATMTTTPTRTATVTITPTFTATITTTQTRTATKSPTLTRTATDTLTPTQLQGTSRALPTNQLATVNPPGFNPSPTVVLATVIHSSLDSSSLAPSGFVAAAVPRAWEVWLIQLFLPLR